MSALVDYLSKLLECVLPSEGKKNKLAKKVVAAMEKEVDRDFKVPINLVKHAQHRLNWVERFTPNERTSGFIVFGAIAPRVRGPVHGLRPVAEGYSFAYWLRRVLPAFFAVCRLCEKGLEEASAFTPKFDAARPLREDREMQLRNVLNLTASLPARGFPNESGERVLELAVADRQVVVSREICLRDFNNGCTTSLKLEAAIQGESVKLPYWIPPRAA
jgi:hypothetical protein